MSRHHKLPLYYGVLIVILVFQFSNEELLQRLDTGSSFTHSCQEVSESKDVPDTE